MSLSTLILLPTYNEASNLPSLLEGIFHFLPDTHALIIDDNSPDGTGEVALRFRSQNPRVHLLSRPRKEGLAKAYLAGFRWGLEQDYKVFIEMDADHSHPPELLPHMVKAIQTNDAVVGCRYIKGGGTKGWSLIREGISRGGNIYARAMLNLPYKDLTGGFNAWRRHVLEKIDLESIQSAGYAFQIELKYRAHSMGFQLMEMPFEFRERKAGQSKMDFRIIFEAAKRVWEMRRGNKKSKPSNPVSSNTP